MSEPEIKDGLVKEAVDAARAKETLFRRDARILSDIAAELALALGAGRTLWLLGDGVFCDVARYGASAFLAGERPLRAIALSEADAVAARQLDTLVAPADAIVVAALEGVAPATSKALARARSRGAKVIALAGPAGAANASPDLTVAVPTRRAPVLAETFVATLHLLQGLVESRLAVMRGEAPSPPKDAPPREELPPLDPLPLPVDPAKAPRPRTHKTEALARAELPRPEAKEPPRPDAGPKSDVAAVEPVVEAEVVGDDPEEVIVAEVVEPLPVHLAGVTIEAVPVPPPPAGMIRFRCPKCSEQITVDKRYAARRGQCPRCLGEFVIPKQGDTATMSRRAIKVSGVHPQGDRRRAVRVEIKDALVSWGHGAFPKRGESPAAPLDDVSLTGISFTLNGISPADLKVGEVIHVAIDAPAYVEPLRAIGEIRRMSPKKESPHSLSVGVRFNKLDGETQARIKRLVDNVALRGVSRGPRK